MTYDSILYNLNIIKKWLQEEKITIKNTLIVKENKFEVAPV